MTADNIDFAGAFLAHLRQLQAHDKGAMAVLRRSLGFDVGCYPPAYPFVERFVGHGRHAEDPLRRALYCVAGLFAMQPHHLEGRTFASAFGLVMRRRESASIEQRFVALLSADADNLPHYLRQSTSLLAADDQGFDIAQLLRDLTHWLNPHAHEARDRLRQRWARDFYNALSGDKSSDSESIQTLPQGEKL